MPDIWVDPVFGNNTNTGLSAVAAKASFAVGYSTYSPSGGAVLHLLPGIYRDQLNNFTPDKNGAVIQAEGVVRFNLTAGSGVTTAFSLRAGITTTFIGVRFEDYATLFQFDAQTPPFISSPQIASLILKNVTASKGPSGGRVFHAIGDFIPQVAVNAILRLYMDACTFRYPIICRASDRNTAGVGQEGLINLDWVRNCLFDYTTFSSLEGQGAIAYNNTRFNAYTGAAGAAGAPASTEVGSIFSHTPSYTDVAADPPDLHLIPASVLRYSGEFGGQLGAFFYPTRFSQVGDPLRPTDWTNWSNDELYYDTALNAVGVQGVTGASPLILLAAEPRLWALDPTRGGQVAGRMLGPVLDFGKVVTFKAINWRAEEVGNTQVVGRTTGSVAVNNRITEVRFSDTAFARTDTNPTNWVDVIKVQSIAPVGSTGRYFQQRLVLRTNG